MRNSSINKRWFASWSAAGVFALLMAGVVGLKVYAGNMHDQHAGGYEGHGVMLMGVSSPASLAARLIGLPAHIDVIAGLSEQQKAQTMEKVTQASAELNALQQAYQERNSKMLMLLTQEKIDEQAIEGLRREHASMAELGSRRVTQLMVELTKLLTPAQRQRFGGLTANHHGSHG